jgi:hypothetical protein
MIMMMFDYDWMVQHRYGMNYWRKRQQAISAASFACAASCTCVHLQLELPRMPSYGGE